MAANSDSLNETVEGNASTWAQCSPGPLHMSGYYAKLVENGVKRNGGAKKFLKSMHTAIIRKALENVSREKLFARIFNFFAPK